MLYVAVNTIILDFAVICLPFCGETPVSVTTNHRIGMTQAVHAQLMNHTSTIDGIISAIGNSFTLAIRNPVASMIRPPQALKSSIIDGDVSG